MKLSGVPEKAYNSRPSEFEGFWLCACIPTWERLSMLQCGHNIILTKVCYNIFLKQG